MDYITPFLTWLMQCEAVSKNKLFCNGVEAQHGNMQLVTQQINRTEDREYIDGSVLHKVTFTVFDYKDLGFNQLVTGLLRQDVNVETLLSIQSIIDWVKVQEKIGNYPDFGENNEAQRVYTAYGSPSSPAIDVSTSPVLAKYSIPIIVEVLEQNG